MKKKPSMMAFYHHSNIQMAGSLNSAANFFKILSLSPLMDMGPYVLSQPNGFFYLNTFFSQEVSFFYYQNSIFYRLYYIPYVCISRRWLS